MMGEVVGHDEGLGWRFPGLMYRNGVQVSIFGSLPIAPGAQAVKHENIKKLSEMFVSSRAV